MGYISKFILLLVTVTIIDFSIAATDYCKVNCRREGQIYPHTVCAYSEEPKCNNLGHKLYNQGLTEKEKDKILLTHNKLRRFIASGNETRGINGPQPAAEVMPDLVWDSELARIAQHWANQCDYKHDKCHDIVLKDIGQEYVGQNIGISRSYIIDDRGRPYFEDAFASIEVDTHVHDWYDEVNDWDKDDTYKPFRERYEIQKRNSSVKLGHFTQMVWAKTTKVGCGAVRYTHQIYAYYYLVCNYGPGGNILDQRIYIPKSQTGSKATKDKKRPASPMKPNEKVKEEKKPGDILPIREKSKEEKKRGDIQIAGNGKPKEERRRGDIQITSTKKPKEARRGDIQIASTEKPKKERRGDIQVEDDEKPIEDKRRGNGGKISGGDKKVDNTPIDEKKLKTFVMTVSSFAKNIQVELNSGEKIDKNAKGKEFLVQYDENEIPFVRPFYLDNNAVIRSFSSKMNKSGQIDVIVKYYIK